MIDLQAKIDRDIDAQLERRVRPGLRGRRRMTVRVNWVLERWIAENPVKLDGAAEPHLRRARHRKDRT